MAETMLLLWGRNDDGQLGDRTATSSVAGSPPKRKISQGRFDESRSESLRNGLRSVSPTRVAMGRLDSTFGSPSKSSSKQRGSLFMAAAEASSSIPVPCPAFEGICVLNVSCGSRHTLAIVASGDAYSWGWGACGQLGHGDNHCSGVPQVIEALKERKGQQGHGAVTCVSAGGIHSAAVVEDGSVFTWGGSSYGQLGLGPRVTARSMQALPEQVMLPPPSRQARTRPTSLRQSGEGLRLQEDFEATTPLLAKTVACGGMHTAALTEEGVVYCWGRADNGQLGIGAGWVHEATSGVMGVEWPSRVEGHLRERRTASISCGGFHTAALTTEGECYTWGKEDFGMLGCSNEALLKGGLFRPQRITLRHPRDTTADPSIHEEDADGGEKVVAVACGGWHTAVIGANGGLWTCGRGEYGRLGLGDQTSQWLLTPVSLERSPLPSTPTPQEQEQQRAAEDNVRTNSGPEKSTVGVQRLFNAPTDLKKPPLPPQTAPGGGGAGGGGEGAVRTEDPVTMVALGGSHSFVTTSADKVFSFGRQEYGRLGNGNDEVDEHDRGAAFPMEIEALQQPGWRVQALSCGGVHSAAILVREL